MLRPSYSELMQVLNNDPDLDNKITSRYAVVIAASKRARQLINGAEAQATADTNKAVSIAVMEMGAGLIKIIPDAGEIENEIPIGANEPSEYYDSKRGLFEDEEMSYHNDLFDEDVELLEDDIEDGFGDNAFDDDFEDELEDDAFDDDFEDEEE